MTRFMITLEQGVDLVWHAFKDMIGGEIYVKKIPSMKLTDIALASVPTAQHEIIGIRPGEKLHEQMISFEDAPHTYEYTKHYKILPAIHNWSHDLVRINRGKLLGASLTTLCNDLKRFLKINTKTNSNADSDAPASPNRAALADKKTTLNWLASG